MALSVATLAGFPTINTVPALGNVNGGSAGAATDAATYTFTNGVYTPGSNVYVAGILDQQGVNPSRIFFSDNGTGPSSSGSTVPLPTLVSITQVSANGQSLAELPSNYSTSISFNEYTNRVGYAGFVVLLAAALGTSDDGLYPLGYNNATRINPDVPGWTSQGGAYTNAAPSTGYPNPQMRFFVTYNALLIIASTNVG